MMYALFSSMCVFHFAGFALMAALWWPVRKTTYLTALPWILGCWIFSDAMGFFVSPSLATEVNAIARQATNGETIMLLNYPAFTSMVAEKLKTLLITFMLCINAAFLLRDYAQVRIGLIVRLADWHIRQNGLGILLVFITFLPWLLSGSILAYLKSQ